MRIGPQLCGVVLVVALGRETAAGQATAPLESSTPPTPRLEVGADVGLIGLHWGAVALGGLRVGGWGSDRGVLEIAAIELQGVR